MRDLDVRHVDLAVQDRDRSAQSRELLAAFVRSTYFDLAATPPPVEARPVLLWKNGRAIRHRDLAPGVADALLISTSSGRSSQGEL